MSAPPEPLLVVCGPTGAGKSALAMRLTERHPVTILSADSRQIYRGFDVGTAKPSREERARVPHRGVDVADPMERWSAACWADDAGRWIAEARAAGRTPVVVGGTGLYIRALVEPIAEAPALDPARRAALAAFLDGLSPAELRRWCTALDPAKAALGRAQQLRAVETALLAGRRLGDLHAAAPRATRHAARYLVVDPGVERLRAWIAARARAMLGAGWPDEVRRLRASVPPDAPAWRTTGYATVGRLVDGALGVAEAAEAIAIETRQYAKRQRTWFRHQLGDGSVARVDPTDPGADALVERWWHGEEEAR